MKLSFHGFNQTHFRYFCSPPPTHTPSHTNQHMSTPQVLTLSDFASTYPVSPFSLSEWLSDSPQWLARGLSTVGWDLPAKTHNSSKHQATDQGKNWSTNLETFYEILVQVTKVSEFFYHCNHDMDLAVAGSHFESLLVMMLKTVDWWWWWWWEPCRRSPWRRRWRDSWGSWRARGMRPAIKLLLN